MAVESEQFSLADLVVSGIPADSVADFYRQSDGAYILTLKVDAELSLPDGRTVRFNRHVPVRYTETLGRRNAALRRNANEEVHTQMRKSPDAPKVPV